MYLMCPQPQGVSVHLPAKESVKPSGVSAYLQERLRSPGAVVREEEVLKAFPDGVFWLTLGHSPNLLARQAQLMEALGDYRRDFQDIQEGKARLQELLADTTCLLVLDDVWDANHVVAS